MKRFLIYFIGFIISFSVGGFLFGDSSPKSLKAWASNVIFAVIGGLVCGFIEKQYKKDKEKKEAQSKK
ncbi:MAG: hypothetical protein LBR97_00040 [Dysgonamonadaceae bacterium]|jgi:undecaprenyl pyrophosphate phosphatase UppP|nr:hypothetical protein [Dysgonamonadaceae bacterium]